MLFTVEELTVWIGMTRFEMLVQTIAIMISSVVFTFEREKSDSPTAWMDSAWWIFLPLFIADAINIYFCTIVFIRTWIDRTFRFALLRALWSTTVLTIVTSFEYIIYSRMIKNNKSFTESTELIASPLLLLMQLIAFRSCQVT